MGAGVAPPPLSRASLQGTAGVVPATAVIPGDHGCTLLAYCDPTVPPVPPASLLVQVPCCFADLSLTSLPGSRFIMTREGACSLVRCPKDRHAKRLRRRGTAPIVKPLDKSVQLCELGYRIGVEW